MSTHDAKAIVRRVLEEGWNNGNMAVIDELIAEDHIDHSAPPGVASGREGLRQVLLAYRSAFPDLNATIEDMLAEGDRVVTRWSATGTHQGRLMGILPTNRQVRFSGITINRVADGQIRESWSNVDLLGMMQQINAAPL